MPFRSLVTTPEELAKLSAAFELAWIVINQHAPVEPEDEARARELLGYILIALWRDDPSGDLAELAVARYLSDRHDAKPAQRAG